MHKFFLHIRTHILSGLLAVVPLLLCVLAVYLLYGFIDHTVRFFGGHYLDEHHIPGLNVLVLFALLFLTGLIISNVAGQELLRLVERISARIPVVKGIYSIGKQMSDAVTNTPGGKVFQKAVLVNYPNADQWTVAIATGRIRDRNTGEDWLKVFIPMAHPFIGFVYLARESQVRDAGWSVEDTLKMAVSLGIATPKDA